MRCITKAGGSSPPTLLTGCSGVPRPNRGLFVRSCCLLPLHDAAQRAADDPPPDGANTIARQTGAADSITRKTRGALGAGWMRLLGRRYILGFGSDTAT